MKHLQGELNAAEVRIAIVAARFNDYLTQHMLDSAVNAWTQLGGSPQALTVAHVPGSFELGVTARRLAETGEYRAVVCLGCVIRGETDHYDHVVRESAQGVRQASLLSGVPCIFGVVTAENLEQAINRVGAKAGNAGRNAMFAAVEMARLFQRIPAPQTSDDAPADPTI